MKKTHAILLVGATSILLLGGLWATGLLRFGPAPETPTAPEPPKNPDKLTPQQLIVGKWECEAKGLEGGKEFAESGSVTEYNWSGAKRHTYRFVNDTTIEYERYQEDTKKIESCQIEVGKDDLVETYAGQGISFVLKYRRVKDFSDKWAKAIPIDGSKPVTVIQPTLTFKNHEASVTAVTVSPDGAIVASGGDDGVVIIWERATGKVRHKVDTLRGRKDRNEGVRSIDFSPDGSAIASSSAGDVILWNAETGAQRKGMTVGHGYLAAFSPSESQIIAATFDSVHVWDMVADKKLFTRDMPGNISSIAVSPDGKLIASGDLHCYVRVWDAKTGEQKFNYKDSLQMHTVAFSADSKLLAAGSGSRFKLFDLATNDEVPLNGSLATKFYPRPLFHPDGKHLVLEHSRDDSVRLVDLPTGTERLILKGHTGPIKGIAVSRDGKWLVSASQDHTVKVWDVSLVVGPPLKVSLPFAKPK